MTDILPQPPTGELIAEYNRRIQEAALICRQDIKRREGEFELYREERYRRFQDETRDLVRMRDALANLAVSCEMPVHVIPADNPTFLSSAMRAALEADGEKLRGMTGEDHGPFEEVG